MENDEKGIKWQFNTENSEDHEGALIIPEQEQQIIQKRPNNQEEDHEPGD